MTRTVEAIYESGVLRLVEPITGLREHQRLTVTIQDATPGEHPLARAVGIMPDADAREMTAIIDEEFGKVDPNDWK